MKIFVRNNIKNGRKLIQFYIRKDFKNFTILEQRKFNSIFDCYYKDGKIYQKRKSLYHSEYREVKFPIRKEFIDILPKGERIDIRKATWEDKKREERYKKIKKLLK